MIDINCEYKICPKCGCKLININSANGVLYKLCPESTCRTMIKNCNISEMEMDIYSRLQQKLGFDSKTDIKGIKAYMLLKENLLGPLLVKNSRNALSNTRTAFCIVKANDVNEAIKMFKDRFDVIKITKDMIVEVSIVERELWM